MFSPADAEIVAGAPALRRRFLDMTLALTSPPYLAALTTYRARSRSGTRRCAPPRGASAGGGRAARRRGSRRSPSTAPCSSRRGARGSAAHAARYAELCAAIGERGDARLALRVGRSTRRATIRDGARARALERSRPLDLKRGLTTAGPHRDDLALDLGGRDLRAFGSAGTAAHGGDRAAAARERDAARGGASEPLLLLDDPFAELDARRSARILELLGAERTRADAARRAARDATSRRSSRGSSAWRVTDGVIAPDGA